MDTTTWRTRHVRLYDPVPNPNQTIGNCTACAKAMQFNAVSNRLAGVRLGMDWAMTLYETETVLDPFPGTYPPDDTGSNGLASCQAAQQSGDGGPYFWELRGVDGVVQSIMDGKAMSLGTRWDHNMFTPDATGMISLGGGVAGGHQYVARGYVEPLDAVVLRCWWGSFRDVLIRRSDLGELLADNGDAHWQARA